jgi:hypothetical protein
MDQETGRTSPAPAAANPTKSGKPVPSTGIEPVTFSSGGGSTDVLSPSDKALAASDLDRCTAGCTEPPELLDEIARAVALVAALPLSDAGRAEVVERLMKGKGIGPR